MEPARKGMLPAEAKAIIADKQSAVKIGLMKTLVAGRRSEL
jgi:hypothetical protein